jgi:hypothetical protein
MLSRLEITLQVVLDAVMNLVEQGFLFLQLVGPLAHLRPE